MVETWTLIVMFWLLAAVWFFMVRPVRKRQREVQEAQMAVQEGAQIMTTAGLFGRVAWVQDDAIGLEISDGVVVKYARAAVAEVVDDEGHEG